MFILYFIKFSQLEFVLQVHINFFMQNYYFFGSVLYLYFLISEKKDGKKMTEDSKRKK
jgi:hypothetical protein